MCGSVKYVVILGSVLYPCRIAIEISLVVMLWNMQSEYEYANVNINMLKNPLKQESTCRFLVTLTEAGYTVVKLMQAFVGGNGS